MKKKKKKKEYSKEVKFLVNDCIYIHSFSYCTLCSRRVAWRDVQSASNVQYSMLDASCEIKNLS